MKIASMGRDTTALRKRRKGEDVLVYHARNYTEIEGDPLYDPNRHTRLKRVRWDENGMPDFGVPPADTI
ncbi:glycosyl hydrolase [Salmonella enterica subsp. enterica]|uniref:Glycosyl hydrolase n=1 Tax=Salmonella enterica I TaxID=59201 RepID=A0A379V1G6_SALET|nr:glycosyl hydrolase [Salmonella enterica subsp. enterica]